MIRKRTLSIILVITIILISTVVWYVTLKNLSKPIIYQAPALPLKSTFNRQPSQTTQVTAEMTEITNWKIYRDEVHRLEFRYPQDMDGKPVAIQPPDEFNQILLFESKWNQVHFSLYDLKTGYTIGEGHVRCSPLSRPFFG